MSATGQHNALLRIGLDVGSTTVKAVVLDDENNILWKSYKRHNAKQAASVLPFLEEIERRFFSSHFHIYTTGNGGRSLTPLLGAKHIQEVNAISSAVELLHPKAGSVVELGGQDAKVILWKKDGHGRKNSVFFMNDKCAGGTGATLDKIFSKIHMSEQEIAQVRAEGKTIHHIAAKCGVFAETDVVGLMKSGVDEAEIVVSLCTAVVKQNIEVLLHGNVLRDDVLLLGGPHTYFQAFEDVWRKLLPETWQIHKWTPKSGKVSDLIYVPKDAQYFAAIGAVLFGRASMTSSGESHLPVYSGTEQLAHFIQEGKQAHLSALGDVKPGLVSSKEEQTEFAAAYSIPEFLPPSLPKGQPVDVYLGIDGGSTSSKLAIIDTKGELIYKDYVLSKGNPILDVRTMLGNIEKWQLENRVLFNIKGAGVTGYASSILQQAFCLDVSIVETVAHLNSATHYYGDLDVICDVGGQDIKVMFMKHGRVVDVRLNTQCSAGNGYFLQSMANQFQVPVEKYAEHAFSVRQAPSFNYGCAVFMEQDKVNFQQLGWTKDEIMAGLALVLPLNIWNYVVQETNLAKLGTRFLLQGGTQKNLAAVKAQVDFIKSKVKGAEVHCHKYADVAGAIGAGIEVMENLQGKESTFIGFSNAAKVTFTSTNNESSKCTFCSNNCPRTFIDISIPPGKKARYISGYGCEKGNSDSLQEMKENSANKKRLLESCPNLVQRAAEDVFADYAFEQMPQAVCDDPGFEQRQKMVVGIPKLLNLFVYAPFFNAYLRSLGVGKVVYSDFTSDKLWEEGNKWGAIDPCFPAKVAPAHVHNLLKKKEVTHICFPMITHLESMVDNTLGNNACVIQMGTPEVVDAAFTKRRNQFDDLQKEYWKPLVRLDRPKEACGNLFEYFKERLNITEAQSDFAARQGYNAMTEYFARLQSAGKRVINDLVRQDKIGILFLGHPYHHDPGLNHGILEEFQLRGFPVLCIESLPTDPQFLKPLFGGKSEEEAQSPFDISNIWQRNFNRNTNAKIWAAKVAARHPNLAVIDLSSFKCGHDAPTYSYVDNILDASETPHFLFHDIDQNRPSATFKIRIQSIDYFLKHEQRRLRENISSMTDGQRGIA